MGNGGGGRGKESTKAQKVDQMVPAKQEHKIKLDSKTKAIFTSMKS